MRAPVHETENGAETASTANTKFYVGGPGRMGEAHSGVIGTVTIVIIEPRALNRECLARCLGAISGHQVVSFATVDDWLKVSEATSPSLIVLGIAGEPIDAESRQQIARIIETANRSPVVILSDIEDPEQIVETLHFGVQGYIPTSLPLDVVVESMRLVRAGGIFAPASSLMAARRAKDLVRAAKLNGNGLFTARQAAVVDALRRGKANKIIAYELNMSESTVKVHVRNIMKKLKAKNRTEVAFLTNGLHKGERM